MQKTGLNKTINYCIWTLLRHVFSKEQNPSLSSSFWTNSGVCLGSCSAVPNRETDPSDAGGQWNVHSVQLFIITVNSHTSNPSPPQTGGAPAPWGCCQKLTLPSLPLYLATGFVPLGSQCLAHLAGRGLACCHLVTNTQPITDLDLGKQI